MNSLMLTYCTEGSTDERFIGNIIYRTFTELAYECRGEIDVYEPVHIQRISGLSFMDSTLRVALEAGWSHILCVHVDADASTHKHVYNRKIEPCLVELSNNEDVVKEIVPVIPVYMTEAWMLSDINLLIEEIGVDPEVARLVLPSRVNQIERIADPKSTIVEAIRWAYSYKPKRWSKPDISQLYLTLSQKIPIGTLKRLSSYRRFYNACRTSLESMDYM